MAFDPKSLMPTGNLKDVESKDFLVALHKAQRELGKTHEAVQQAFADVDPNFDHALENDFEGVSEVVSQLKLWVDNNNAWE